LRRIIITGTAVAVLVGAGVAYAAFNTYGGTTFKFNGKAGSPKHPAPIGFLETLAAANVNSANRAAPLVDIKTTIYGLKSNAGSFPKCTDAMIVANPAKWDKACPAGSLVAQGPVHARLGDPSLAGSGTPCNPYLHVYNGGKGKLVFFFVIIPPNNTCATLHTGASAPYDGTVKQVGKNLVTDVPLPPDVSTKAGNIQGAYGSLILEKLNWSKLVRKGVPYQASIGCKSGKRPWTVQYTAVTPSGKETQTVKGSSSC
jgi:hypothetical protein